MDRKVTPLCNNNNRIEIDEEKVDSKWCEKIENFMNIIKQFEIKYTQN